MPMSSSSLLIPSVTSVSHLSPGQRCPVQVSGAVDKKICSVGMTKLLCETPPMSPAGNYFSQFTPVSPQS